MRLPTRVGLLAGASALALTGVSFADDQGQDQAARIAELEAQVAKLTGDNWLTEERAEEIRGVVQDVLADADTRASLLQSGMTAGYDNGFVIGSSDGNFSLKLNGQMQARFIYNNQDDGSITNPNSNDTNRWGFENTRTKLIFTGNVGGPQWRYKIQGNFDRDGGDFFLEDAVISYDCGNGWTLMMGQTKVPLNHEYLVDDAQQLAIERSNVSYYYNGGRTQGLLVNYMADQWQVTAGYTDGANQLNTAWSNYDTEYSFTVRGEYLFMGDWAQFTSFTSPRGSEQGLMAGVGFHIQNAESGTPARNELQFYIITGDISWEADGWNLFGSVSYADFDNDAPSGDPASIDYSPIGFVVHGGYYFTDKLEGYARYEYNDFDDFGVSGANIDDLSLLTIGVNHYYNANVKASADIGYGFDAIPLAADITGARTDFGGDDGQVIVRTQLQLTF
jgi:hypothetical protein